MGHSTNMAIQHNGRYAIFLWYVCKTLKPEMLSTTLPLTLTTNVSCIFLWFVYSSWEDSPQSSNPPPPRRSDPA